MEPRVVNKMRWCREAAFRRGQESWASNGQVKSAVLRRLLREGACGGSARTVDSATDAFLSRGTYGTIQMIGLPSAPLIPRARKGVSTGQRVHPRPGSHPSAEKSGDPHGCGCRSPRTSIRAPHGRFSRARRGDWYPRLSWTVPQADEGYEQTAYEVEISRDGSRERYRVDSGEQVLVPW